MPIRQSNCLSSRHRKPRKKRKRKVSIASAASNKSSKAEHVQCSTTVTAAPLSTTATVPVGSILAPTEATIPDEILVGYGKFQRMLLACAHLSAVTYILHHLSMRLLAPPVDHWCKQPEHSNLSREEWLNWSIPLDKNGRRSRCTVYEPPIPATTSSNESRRVMPCTEWDYDLAGATKTVTSQWNLVCQRAWYVPLSTSYYIFGSFMLVPLLALASDKVGRKYVVNACVVGVLCFSFTAFFAKSFLVFVVARMFMAACISTLMINTFVLLFEATTPSYRDRYSSLAHFGTVIGSTAVSVLETDVFDKRVIEIVCMMPTSMLVLSFYAVEDSPRWLVATWNLRGAKRIVLWAAQVNKVALDFKTLGQQYSKKKSEIPQRHGVTILDIVVHPVLRGRTVSLCCVWFCLLFSLHGMQAINPRQVNFETSMMVFFPRTGSVALSYVLLKTYDRKASLGVVFPLTSGLACVLSVSITDAENDVVKVLHELTLSSTMLSVFIIYTYTMELFPTVIRVVGVSVVFLFGRIGAIVSPFLGHLGDWTHPSVPLLLIAFFMISARLFLRWLPETKRGKLPDTMKDLEIEAMRRMMMVISER